MQKICCYFDRFDWKTVVAHASCGLNKLSGNSRIAPLNSPHTLSLVVSSCTEHTPCVSQKRWCSRSHLVHSTDASVAQHQSRQPLTMPPARLIASSPHSSLSKKWRCLKNWNRWDRLPFLDTRTCRGRMSQSEEGKPDLTGLFPCLLGFLM